MKIVSSSFEEGNEIPSVYTCDGKDISPELSWSGYPPETKSFVLVCHDPDSPSGNFIHWATANIPDKINNVNEGDMTVKGALNIDNDFGKPIYGGPCPGTGTHRYIFTVYALSTDLLSEIDKNNMLTMIKPYILDQASITGVYERKIKN